IGQAEAFRTWRRAEVAPGPDMRTRSNLRTFVRQAVATYHHQAGTCRMGVDSMSVVNPDLKVHGTAHLRVADASVMPSVTSGNTNAPSIMIGEKAADIMLHPPLPGGNRREQTPDVRPSGRDLGREH